MKGAPPADLSHRRTSFFHLVVVYAILEVVAFTIVELVSHAPTKKVVLGFVLFLCAAVAFSLIQKSNVAYAGTEKYCQRFAVACFAFFSLCIVASTYCLVTFGVIPRGAALGFWIVGMFCSALAAFSAYSVASRQHKGG